MKVIGQISHEDKTVPGHIDWAVASAGIIHATNYVDNNTVYTLPEATATAKGGIELFSDTDQSVVATAVSTTASRTYGLQLNAAGQGVVNIPWVDTDTNTTYSVGDGGLTTNDFTNADHSKLNAIEASATADQSKADIDGLAITTVGTIDTGVWGGTAIATDQQNHLMHYTFSGYTEGNGSTYEIPVAAHDAQAPFEHNTSTGADGLDAITVQNQVRTNGKVMTRAGSLKKWTGWATGENTSGTTNIALFKVTPANDSTSTVSPVLLKEIAFSAGGNSRSFAIAETSFSVDVAAGDVVFTGIKGISAKDVYFTSTLEIEF